MASVKRVLTRFWQSKDPEEDSLGLAVVDSPPNGSMYTNSSRNLRDQEFPSLIGTTYLDHAGATPYPKSAIECWTSELTTNLFGNPHSGSASSQLSTRRVDDIRLRALQYFNASPEDYDIVFVANATAAIKLVAEAFRDNEDGFWYGYHVDSHTSLVGCRELAIQGSQCFDDDESLEQWVEALANGLHETRQLRLIAYPGQSNMTGRCVPAFWPRRVRDVSHKVGQQVFTLLDAASLAATSPLDLADPSVAPDFVALSFCKMFGFPNLGGLLVRKQSMGVLRRKRYFAGGTVDAVTTGAQNWHAKRFETHHALEEGTLPFHNIIALDHAMTAHTKLFGSMEQVSRHTRSLRNQAKAFLCNLRHGNGTSVCEIYEELSSSTYGPVLAFNFRDSLGKFISASEVEKLCIVKGIQLRTGGLCNPGGIARHLQLSASQIRANYSAGYRCGGESDLINGKPNGAVRISFGASSIDDDFLTFADFVKEFYVEKRPFCIDRNPAISRGPGFFIESLSIFPIKSCAAFGIAAEQRWPVTSRGLAWDREWCLIHAGTNVALSQKKYPRMALLCPYMDLKAREMVVRFDQRGIKKEIAVSLDDRLDPDLILPNINSSSIYSMRNSKVCGSAVSLQVYTSKSLNDFFSEILDVPCCLARYPVTGVSRKANIRKPYSESLVGDDSVNRSQIMLANESPMLIVSSSSIQELNRQMRMQTIGREDYTVRQVTAQSFRANIVVSERGDSNSPYAEDRWSAISIIPESSIDVTRVGLTAQEIVSDQLILSSTVTRLNGSSSSSAGTNSVLTGSSNTAGSIEYTTSLSEFNEHETSPDLQSPTGRKVITLDILGPCQRCQMVSVDQMTAESQPEPFSILSKTRRKGDGRVWFGVHAALASDVEDCACDIGVGDLVFP